MNPGLPMSDTASNRSFYKQHPTTCAPDDYWGQVKRTVNGRPVGPEQIGMITDQVSRGLDIRDSDILLDLCCGNGALTSLFFSRCAGGLGVDFSEPLVQVAKTTFMRRPTENFILQEAVDFVRSYSAPRRFTIALCYGAFSFFTLAEAETLLAVVYGRFSAVRRLFLGNLPDRTRAQAFFGERYRTNIEDDPGSALGVWHNIEDLLAMAERCGWRAEVLRMPPAFYAAHYRYDLVLTRPT